MTYFIDGILTLDADEGSTYTGNKVISGALTVTAGPITSPNINATTALKINGADINTSGTLNNIAYLNKANIFSIAGAASAPALTLSGVPFAGTGTTSFPLLYLNNSGATASTTLSTSGTAFGVNSHGAPDLLNLMVDGISKFKVTSAGALNIPIAAPASANSGLLTLGNGPFDGVSAGYFVGPNAGTFIAMNIPESSFGKFFLDCQIDGYRALAIAEDGSIIGGNNPDVGNGGLALYPSYNSVYHLYWNTSGTAQFTANNYQFNVAGSTPKLSFFSATSVVKQTRGGTLTNNATVGGTTDQIDDFTSLTVYATDAAAIRNDIYQLARAVRQIDVALRAYGLLT